jgi:hypothetical protein
MFLLRMTDLMTAQNVDLSSWDSRCIKKNSRINFKILRNIGQAILTTAVIGGECLIDVLPLNLQNRDCMRQSLLSAI